MSERTDDARLAAVFADVARSLLGEHSLEATLGRICEVAVSVVPGCEAAGTSIVRGRQIDTLAATGALPRRLDELQHETGEGPCLDAIRQREVFETGDLAAEARWPRFAPRAVQESDIRSVLSIRLYAEEDTYGALNMYASSVDAYGEEAHAVGGILAAHGSVAFARMREREQADLLQLAIDSRDVIGQAKGILMQRRGVTAAQAFTLLVRASQQLNRRLRDVAEDVAVSGTDPEQLR